MSNKIAIIKDNVVSNIIVATNEFANTLPETTVDVTGLNISIGCIYSNGDFIFPESLLSSEEMLSRKEIDERQWRDYELTSTDFIAPLTDHPKHAAYLVYRQELRDYPQQADFPNGERPVKP